MQNKMIALIGAAALLFSHYAIAQSSAVPKSFSDLRKEAGGPIHNFGMELAAGEDPTEVKSVTQLNCFRKMIVEYKKAVANVGGDEAFHPPRTKYINDISLNLYDATGSSKQQSTSIQDDDGNDEKRGLIFTAAVWGILSTDPQTHLVTCKYPSAAEIEGHLRAKPYSLTPPSASSSGTRTNSNRGSAQ